MIYIMHGPSHLFIKTNYIYCRLGILNSRARPAKVTITTTEFDWAANEAVRLGSCTAGKGFQCYQLQRVYKLPFPPFVLGAKEEKI